MLQNASGQLRTKQTGEFRLCFLIMISRLHLAKKSKWEGKMLFELQGFPTPLCWANDAPVILRSDLLPRASHRAHPNDS